MNEPTSPRFDDLDPDLARRIDVVCRRFEADWRAGNRPTIGDYLAELPDQGRSVLRAELAVLERELRQSEEIGAPSEAPLPSVAEAPTIAPGPPPTLPMEGAAPSSVHDEATLLPRDEATVDLGTAEPAQAEARSPARIRYFGDYEIVRELARGGMGVVFQARQVSLNRPVALKMILAGQLANEADVRRFHIEAESAANLDHPGIVPIYEVGEHEGQHYFSMGFVEGRSLSGLLAAGPLPPRQAAELMVKVAEAIEYAHQRSVIHRDLKPANILLDQNGNPRVTDFGLAKKLEGDSGLTGSGQIMGTPSYMPPEQAGGQRGDVGPKADVYALGATLYALVTGRPPFQAATAMDTVLMVISDEPVPLRRLNVSVPRDLETICLKCLEKEQGKRYVSALALGEDLRRYLAGEPIAARPVGRTERTWRWCRRNLVVASLTGGIVLALVMGTVVATYFAVRANHEAQRVRDEKQLSDRRLYIAEMNLAQRAWQEGNLDLFQRRLIAYLPKELDAPDLRGFEWYYLDRLRQLELRTLGGHLDRGSSIAYSPDGRTLASAGADGIVLWDAASGEVHRLGGRYTRGGSYTRGVFGVAFSPDGRTLASASGNSTVKLWDTVTGTEVQTLNGHAGVVTCLAYSLDGRTLASADGDGTVTLWDTITRKEIGVLRGHTRGVRRLAYSPDGRSLAAASGDATVKLWDTVTGTVVCTLSGHPVWVYGLAYSPDGRTLASANGEGTVTLWDTASGREAQTLRGHSGTVAGVPYRPDIRDKGNILVTSSSGTVAGVVYSPDGRTLASAAVDGTVTLWDATTGKEVLTLRGQSGFVLSTEYGPESAAYSPDGRTLAVASADNSVQFWDTATGKAIRTVRSPRGATDLAYSPDGRILASVTSDRTVELWDATTTEEVLVLRGHSGTVAGVVYSPDGRTLASASGDQTVKLWDAATGKELRTLRGHAGAVLGVAYSPDGRTLASASEDQTVKLWDAADGKEIRTLRGHGDGVGGVAFSPDGRTLASASSDNTVKLWDAAIGNEVRTIRGHRYAVDCVAYSPDGRALASAGVDGTVKLWDVITDAKVQELRTTHVTHFRTSTYWDNTKRQMVTSVPRAAQAYNGIVAYSPDGRILASASPDNTVHLWDSAGKEVGTLLGHFGAVFGVAFSPDGRRVASASTDGTVKLWDRMTGQEVLTLHGHANAVNGVAFSPDGSQLACACGDGTVQIWDARPLTPELRTTREARSVLEFLLAQRLPSAAVLPRIRRDPTISEEVRQRALDLAEPRVQALVNDEADRLVRSLFDKLVLKDDVLEGLRADTTLSKPVREQALALTERSADDPNRLNEASWAVARRPDAGAPAYRRALRVAEVACRLAPNNGLYLNTLGVAQYRSGRYSDAVTTLMRSDQLNAQPLGGSEPADLAFLALAQHRLGQTEKARDTLRRLRETMKKPERAKNQESQGFLREAETIEQDLVFPADPFAL